MGYEGREPNARKIKDIKVFENLVLSHNVVFILKKSGKHLDTTLSVTVLLFHSWVVTSFCL